MDKVSLSTRLKFGTEVDNAAEPPLNQRQSAK
jgi:hypothetical protein